MKQYPKEKFALSKSIEVFLLVSVFLVCGFLSPACADELAKNNITCIENVLNSKVVRVDNSNQRLFIVHKAMTDEFLSKKIDGVSSCLNKSSWGRDWAISVFSEAKYAGYKDEKNILPLHKNNEWAHAYKIEYLNINRTLIANPALDPEEIKVD